MRIMIIGGTSGIGLALAEHYARQGAQLALCGRDISRLNGHPLRTSPAIRLYQFSIADSSSLRKAIDDFALGGLDMLIVTAARYVDAVRLGEQPELGMALLHTNVGGLIDAFEASSALMRNNGGGHLVAVASIAGLLNDYPGASLYGASKRVALGLCDAYRKALAPFGIAVTAIVPGYVDTASLRELNGGDAGAKPFLQTEATAVQRIVDTIDRRAEQCIFPWQLHWLVRVFNCLPVCVRQLRRK